MTGRNRVLLLSWAGFHPRSLRPHLRKLFVSFLWMVHRGTLQPQGIGRGEGEGGGGLPKTPEEADDAVVMKDQSPPPD